MPNELCRTKEANLDFMLTFEKMILEQKPFMFRRAFRSIFSYLVSLSSGRPSRRSCKMAIDKWCSILHILTCQNFQRFMCKRRSSTFFTQVLLFCAVHEKAFLVLQERPLTPRTFIRAHVPLLKCIFISFVRPIPWQMAAHPNSILS